MNWSRRGVALLLTLALLAGGLGAYLYDILTETEAGLHAFVHAELELDDAQQAALDLLENEFAVQRATLEVRMLEANNALADAMAQEHEYGDLVASAIEDVHATMGEMQKATVAHVFAMRAILNPRQQEAFDRKVDRALTQADH